jgi:hypothetical protein
VRRDRLNWLIHNAMQSYVTRSGGLRTKDMWEDLELGFEGLIRVAAISLMVSGTCLEPCRLNVHGRYL